MKADRELEQQLALKILETIPPAMRQIREKLREATHSSSELTVPQLRTLGCVFRDMKNVGQIAVHLGVSQPAASKIVDGLVQKKLLARSADADDKRKIGLTLTAKGTKTYGASRQYVINDIAKQISRLSAKDKAQLASGLDKIADIFGLLEAPTREK